MSETQFIKVQNQEVRDRAERERALELATSFIVRAPAGSGKTDLLTRRFLKLLAAVNEPEDILAVTFTRAATAEMRARVLGHLEDAARTESERQTEEDERISLARAALAQSERRGWNLLAQPHRLNIETIDSLCLHIAHGQPRLSRLGGQLTPTEQGAPLYAQAARRTLGQLGGSNAALNEGLTHLLELRDNNLADCEALLAGMLAHRDQWVRAFPLVDPDDAAVDWDVARSHLEAPFRREVRKILTEAHALLVKEPVIAQLLLELAGYACSNGYDDVALIAGLSSLPPPESLPLDHWRCISRFLLTSEGELRKPRGLNKNLGFPSTNQAQKQQKQRMEFLLKQMSESPSLVALLAKIGSLPKPRYDEDQWQTLRHLFTALRHAAAELRIIFAELNTVDFTELGIAAREVLSNEDAGSDRLLALSGNIRHLLIDEFQDTSRSQHELIRLLVRAWDEGDGRTCFLVGDPMQSIYMFRQAEVELFYRVESDGLVSDDHCVDCTPVQLLTNFRSHAGLTDRWNEIFDAIFKDGSVSGAVPFSPSFAAELARQGNAVHVHPQIIGAPGRKPTQEEKLEAQQREAEKVLAIIAQHTAAIESAKTNGSEYRVAVLVRVRKHLAEIARLLRERAIPFRAVELETLAERQELLDLRSLTRALLHPMDRVAWLSVLRAPWCGLTLRDLHLLTGQDDRDARRIPMLDLVAQNLHLLDADAQARASHTVRILQKALETRFAGTHASSFSQWIERTWRSLGAHECVDAASYENALVYFSMLDAVTPDGLACLTGDFDAEFDRLFAQPDPTVSERAGVQLMTIHKAKGLGFEAVIVPGLDRKPASDRQELIVSLERSDSEGNDEMLVAPIGGKGGEKHPTYAWVQKQRELRIDEERKRLLYVACTRARQELHLLGTASITASGLQSGDSKSLLNAAWPAFKAEFAAAAQIDTEEQPSAGDLITFPNDGLQIAASAQPAPTLKLRRLREPYQFQPTRQNVRSSSPIRLPAEESIAVRPEGSRRARTVGSTVHALLDAASRGVVLSLLKTQARQLLRTSAFAGRVLDQAMQEVLAAIENCMSDPHGAWILQPREGAESETAWTGWFDGRLQTLHADRVFVAGPEPGIDHARGFTPSTDTPSLFDGAYACMWIIDYKMSAPAGEAIEDFLAYQRTVYTGQLARYAEALRAVRGDAMPIRFGLYYPRIAKLDWWAKDR